MPRVVPEYKEDAKRRIIEAAMDVMAEKGCEALAIDDVAKKIGVTKGAVYWYFPSREKLIAEVFHKIQTDIQKVSFEAYYNRPLEETLALIFDRFTLNDSRQQAIFFEMLALSNRNPDIRHATREYFHGITATIEEAIRMEKRKEFLQTQTDAHALALLMVALFSGLRDYELLWMSPAEIRALWIEGVKILLRPSYTGSYGEGKP
jgi:AcrR family transcriptional regulator